MKRQVDIENVEKLLNKKSSSELFWEALKEISPSKVGYRRTLVSSVLMLIPSIVISFSAGTIPLFLKSVETFNTVIIGLFAIVFTGYAFFQALINDNLLIKLLNTNKEPEKKNCDKMSKLQESNEYFAKVMMLDIISIMINVFLIITIGSIGSEFHLPFDHFLNNNIAFISIFLYFNFEFNVVWEMKSFVFNLFQLFNSHAAVKAIDIIKQENDEEVEKKFEI